MGDGPMRAARGLWRAAVPRSVRGLAQPLAMKMAIQRVQRVLAHSESAAQPGPLVVSGLISESKGVSEAARLTLLGLKSAGFSPLSHDLRPLLDSRGGLAAKSLIGAPRGVWIIHANAPEAIKALALIDPSQWMHRYRVGYWAYELPKLPALWSAASSAFHEIWVPSRFVADALRVSKVSVPVRVMPHPVALQMMPMKPDRLRFNIPERSFAVLAIGDLNSSVTRKNLFGSIQIYRRAFPIPDGKSVLIVKVQSDHAHRAFRAEASAAIDGRPDILIQSGSLSADDARQLVMSCDVVLSPHRSEGYGLVLAEALSMGVPALATAWSGNMDFMADLPELLIAHTLVPVRDPSGIYSGKNTRWAEADLDDAASKLLALADNPTLRRQLAAKGGSVIRSQLRDWSRERLQDSPMSAFIAA